MHIFEIIFWLSVATTVYVYLGYCVVLRTAAWFAKSMHPVDQGYVPDVTVIVTVHNEEEIIERRSQNLKALNYPSKKLEIIVASDGSTDNTDAIVKQIDDPRVRLFRPTNQGGKSVTQNQAIRQAQGNIIVFSDADTHFEPGFLKHIVKPFSDPEVGAVDGHLLFIKEKDKYLSTSQGYYWNYELRLRELESHLGILAVMSGACMAIRKELFIDMPPSVGEDCIVPLDIVLQGKQVVHCNEAVAFDRMEHNPKDELRTRIRMTLRNWQGTWSRPALLNPFRHPGYAFALWSHKILRWLSPFFLIVMTISIFSLATQSYFFSVCAIATGLFCVAGLIGWICERNGWKAPGVGIIFSFLLANTGFFIGVLKALVSKKQIISYR